MLYFMRQGTGFNRHSQPLRTRVASRRLATKKSLWKLNLDLGQLGARRHEKSWKTSRENSRIKCSCRTITIRIRCCLWNSKLCSGHPVQCCMNMNGTLKCINLGRTVSLSGCVVCLFIGYVCFLNLEAIITP